MARLLDKIKRFFKRGREEDDCNCERLQTKRARYISTPAPVKFNPKQVRQKRVARQFYLIDELLDVTEDRNYEFKAGGMLLQKNSLRMMIQKYGSAFLNSEGGVIIGGVSDTGKVIGIYCTLKQEVELEDTVKNEFEHFRPVVDQEMYFVKFLPVKRTSSSLDSSLKVVEIHVYKGDDRHLYETGSHEVYIRRDGGVQGPLRPLAIKDLVEQKYQKVLKNRLEKENADRDSAKKSSPPVFEKENIRHAIEKESDEKRKSNEDEGIRAENPSYKPTRKIVVVGKPRASTVGIQLPNGRNAKESTDRNTTERHLAQQGKQITNEPPSKRRFFTENVTTFPHDIQMPIKRHFVEKPSVNWNVQARSFGSTNMELHQNNHTIYYSRKFFS